MPLDVALGILLSLGVAEYFGIEATPLFIAFGVAAALLPDIDILTIPLLGKWYHRTHTHFPITYVPFVAIAFIALDPAYAALLTLGVYAHLIHDTFGIGHGVAWLWPFSQRKFLFLVPATRDDENVGWVRRYYFRPNVIAYVEYGALLVALVVLWQHFA